MDDQWILYNDGPMDLEEADNLIECALMATRALVAELTKEQGDVVEHRISPIKRTLECASQKIMHTHGLFLKLKRGSVLSESGVSP